MNDYLDILSVAKILAGSKIKINGCEARVGSSISINMEKCVFFDHKQGVGGDTIDFIQHLSLHPLNFIQACQWYEDNVEKIPSFNCSSISDNNRVSVSANPELLKESSFTISPEMHQQSRQVMRDFHSLERKHITHEYADKKAIKPYHARLSGGTLIVPVFKHSELITVQMITVNGDKYFLRGAPLKGGALYILPSLDSDEIRLNIAEGYATACTIAEHTNEFTVCCFTASNMALVAEKCRVSYPNMHIRLCADNDHETYKRTGVNAGIKAAKKSHELLKENVSIVHPPSLDGVSDFNDMWVKHGDIGL